MSLTTPRRESPGVFEGGNADEHSEHNPQHVPQAGVTDVLIGMASPGRGRHEGNDSAAARALPAELDSQRSRCQLLGELGSVLRARPIPPTCEKRLPLESQQSLSDEERGGEEQEQDYGPGGMEDITPSLASPLPEPAVPQVPVCESVNSQDLMSELRAQLSLAANEEIFCSYLDQKSDQWAVKSDIDGENNVLIEPEGQEVVQASASNRNG